MKKINLGFRFLILVVLLIIIVPVQAQVAFPLKISNNKRYLVDDRNKPFPILGRTAWFIMSMPDSGYKYFLDNTLAHGCNAIEFSVITHWAIGNHAPFDDAGEAPFLKRLNGADWDGKLTYNEVKTESPDLLTPNEKYWKRVDKLLAYCESKRILVFMFPGYVGYANEKEEQGWMRELVANGEKTIQYGTWIATRYKNRKNIIWMLLGDKGLYTAEQAKGEANLIKGLKSVAGQQSVQYTAESNSGENAADNVQYGHEMTLNASYTWELKIPVPYIARKAYAHDPVMPSFLLEEPYDEEGPDGNNYNPNATQPVRRFQWWGWLSTIGGYVAGNAYIWQFVDPIWQQHLNTQGAMDMTRLNGFIQSIPWWKLVPSGLNGMKTIITNTNNVDTSAAFVSAAAAKDGSLLVAYLPPAHNGSIDVDVSVLKGEINGRWLDPTNAKYIAIKENAFNKKGVQTFTPPGKNSRGENDWVLILSKKER
jgi:hypothetical protein